jgi:aconitate hydratase
MDARSVAATARNQGYLCSALGLEPEEPVPPYRYDGAPYRARVYQGLGRPEPEAALRYGPNITDWPDMDALGENLLLKIVSFITDPVTTTDEIIPSGETSSYRSNPLGLAEFTLSRKDPAYVGRAKALHRAETARKDPSASPEGELPELASVMAALRGVPGFAGLGFEDVQLGSAIYAVKPGDGSAREQAASCQRVLGGAANFTQEYATKRYRSNLINWGIIPFVLAGPPPFANGDYVWVPGAAKALREQARTLTAYAVRGSAVQAWELAVPELESAEWEILLAGCLINYNRQKAREGK